MKRTAIIFLCLLLLLGGCGPRNEFDKLVEAERVLVDWGSEPLISYSGNRAIEPIYENLSSLKLKELKRTEPTIEIYRLEFYDASGKLLLNMSLSYEGWLSLGGKIYAITEGEFDTAWIDMLISQSAGPAPG